jgi:hypothetical protein
VSDYNKGGFLKPGVIVIGEIREGERILTAAEWERLRSRDD